MAGIMIDSERLRERVKKMRHRHDMDKNGTLVWIERERVLDLIDWVAAGGDMQTFLRIKEARKG